MAARISIVYVVCGCLWIFFGDTILKNLINDEGFTTNQVIAISMAKGLSYVLVTGIALYLYLRHSIKGLRSLELQYRQLFKDNPNPMWVFDVENQKILSANNNAENIYGYTKEEFAKLTVNQLFDEDAAQLVKSTAKQINSGVQVFKQKKKDGSIFYANIYINEDTNFGNRLAKTVVAIDISEKLVVEQKLESYSKYIATILDSISDGFVALDKEWRFTYANNVFKSMTAKTEEELLGIDILKVFPQLQGSSFWSKVIEVGKKKESTKLDISYFGNNRWYTCTIYPNPIGISMFFSDFTEIREMNSEILRAKNNLNSLINNTADLIWSVNTNLELITFNNAYKDIVSEYTDLKIAEGQKVYSASAENEAFREKWVNNYKRGLAGEFFTTEEEIKFRGKETRVYEVSFNPIKDHEGKIYGLGCFGRNITEIKKNSQKLTEQNKQLIEIAWYQSHKVRAPLSNILAIVGYMKLLDVQDEESQKLLEMLEESSQKLDEVIQSVVNKSFKARVFDYKPNKAS